MELGWIGLICSMIVHLGLIVSNKVLDILYFIRLVVVSIPGTLLCHASPDQVVERTSSSISLR